METNMVTMAKEGINMEANTDRVVITETKVINMQDNEEKLIIKETINMIKEEISMVEGCIAV
eukprot:2414370-Ditylum_brightwellii.AAC.1